MHSSQKFYVSIHQLSFTAQYSLKRLLLNALNDNATTTLRRIRLREIHAWNFQRETAKGNPVKIQRQGSNTVASKFDATYARQASHKVCSGKICNSEYVRVRCYAWRGLHSRQTCTHCLHNVADESAAAYQPAWATPVPKSMNSRETSWKFAKLRINWQAGFKFSNLLLRSQRR